MKIINKINKETPFHHHLSKDYLKNTTRNFWGLHLHNCCEMHSPRAQQKGDKLLSCNCRS